MILQSKIRILPLKIMIFVAEPEKVARILDEIVKRFIPASVQQMIEVEATADPSKRMHTHWYVRGPPGSHCVRAGLFWIYSRSTRISLCPAI